jgi:3-oxoacyl-[acyl-carrier protein] reductase
MNLGISRKVAMVAASSKGIGLAVAKELAAEGCRVSLCGRDPASLESAAGTVPGAVWTACDVSKGADLERWHADTLERLGPPEILVTNTGGPPAGPWSELTDEQWLAGYESTLMNVVRLVRLTAPSMRERGWGRIVHVTSLVAKQPAGLLPISSTLRSGLMSLVRLQSDELAPHGTTVNAVLPGHTMTDRQVHLAQVRGEREGIPFQQALAEQAAAVPVGRLAEAREIAAVVAFLCSERASYVTGVNLLVDGGIVRGPG